MNSSAPSSTVLDGNQSGPTESDVYFVDQSKEMFSTGATHVGVKRNKEDDREEDRGSKRINEAGLTLKTFAFEHDTASVGAESRR